MEIKEVIKQMTLEEKASLCSGKNVWETQDIKRLGIPSLSMSDGPHGLRKQLDKSDILGINNSYPATCFPTAVTTACSFDRDLLEKMGEGIGNECIDNDVDIILGPGVNMKRSPLCGRNFEYFSEDPFLTGELGAYFVRGVQKCGVGVSLKHFAGNNQETLRLTVSAEIDERALREIYLASFERIIEEKPYTLMCSYNRINGIYSSENKYLLTDVLRNEWDYKGVLITDWGACNDRLLGIKNGQDLEMPSSYGINNQLIIDAVNNGELEENILDKTVERILNLVFKCRSQKKDCRQHDNHKLAYEIASESLVLLKNDDHLLPLKENTSIAIIGEMAKNPRYQGSGSSKINPMQLDNVIEILNKENKSYNYAQGYSLETGISKIDLLNEAIEIAKKVDIPIVFIGLTEQYESEGFDRVTMDLPFAQNRLIEEVTKVNSNVVVVLSGGAPVAMPWLSEVKVLLNAYLAGESGAKAIVDILYGIVNPSGKLAETYPLKLADNPSFLNFPGGNKSVYYEESIYIGYRYYEKKGQKVLFPFGFGLSYTTFLYHDLKVNKTEIEENEKLEVTFNIKNTGLVAGKEVCQLYVRDIESTVFKPVKELKGFDKVYLNVGEEKKITMKLDKRSFSYYHVTLKDWVVESGDYEILIGTSSLDIKLKTIVKVNSIKEVKSPYKKNDLESYYNLDRPFNKDEFVNLLGRVLPPSNEVSKRPYHYNSTLQEMSHTCIGKIIVWIGKRQIRNATQDESTRRMMEKSLIQLPYRALISFSENTFSKEFADCLLLLINGKYFKGIRKMIHLKNKSKSRDKNE